MTELKQKAIYCPNCGRLAFFFDEKSTVHQMAKCKNCKKLVVYRIDTGETKIKDIPQRNCSSGMRIY